MRFHQAYYTWDWEQITKYQGGLGIHASSCTNNDFLNCCMKLGSRLNPEPDNETAELLLYSQELGYVGTYISPREDVSGKNRANMLCHFFAPDSRPEELCLEDYLVEHPYHVSMEEVLEPVECQSGQSEHCYEQILEKYNFNSEKMAVLIWRLYQKLFDKLSKVPVVISRKMHPDRQKDGQMARDLTWLMYQLAPKKELKEKQWYDKFTYGVHTQVNTREISIYYTDENIWNNAVCIDEENDMKKVPQVFLKMGELACSKGEQSGLICVQEFIDALREDSPQKSLSYDELDFLFERWKMNHGYTVHVDFIKDSRILLRKMWDQTIYKKRNNFAFMDEAEKDLYQEAAFSLLQKMRAVNQSDFATALQSLPKESQQDILEKYMKEKATFILEELDGVCDRASLESAVLKYECLAAKYPLIIDKLIPVVKNLYEDGDREERERISSFMEDEMREECFKTSWNNYQNIWQSVRDTDILGFLTKQKGRIEVRHLAKTYECLIVYAETLDSKQEKIGEVIDAEKAFLEENPNLISEEATKKFETIKRNWKIAQEVSRLKRADLKTLFEKDLKELEYLECWRQWFRSATEILRDFRTRLTKEELVQLLAYRTEGWNLFLQEETLEEWKDFDKQLKKLISPFHADFTWKVLYYTNHPADHVSEIWTYLNLNLESFEEFFHAFEEHPEEGNLARKSASHKRVFFKKAYLLWEEVKRGTIIHSESFKSVPEDQIRQLIPILEKTLLERKEWMASDLMNLCHILALRFSKEERTYHAYFRRVFQYERMYRNQSLVKYIKESKEVFQIRMNLKEPYRKILDEMLYGLEADIPKQPVEEPQESQMESNALNDLTDTRPDLSKYYRFAEGIE